MAVNSLWSPGSGRCRHLKVAGEAYSARSRLAHLVIWSARGVGPVRLGSILLKTAADRLSVVPENDCTIIASCLKMIVLLFQIGELPGDASG